MLKISLVLMMLVLCGAFWGVRWLINICDRGRKGIKASNKLADAIIGPSRTEEVQVTSHHAIAEMIRQGRKSELVAEAVAVAHYLGGQVSDAIEIAEEQFGGKLEESLVRIVSEVWETPENRLIAACGRLHRAGVSHGILLTLAEKENSTLTVRERISALYKQFESGAGRGQLRILLTSDNPKPVPHASCALSVTERHFIRLCGRALLAEAKAGGTAGAAQYIFSLGLRGDSADAVRDHLLEDALAPAMMEIAGSSAVRDQLDVAANWYGLGREDAVIVAAYWRNCWAGMNVETREAFVKEGQLQGKCDYLVFLDSMTMPENERCNRARNWGIGRAGEACRLGLTRQQWQDSERELGTPPFGIFRGLVAWIEWEVRQEKAALDHRRAHET